MLSMFILEREREGMLYSEERERREGGVFDNKEYSASSFCCRQQRFSLSPLPPFASLRFALF